MHHRCRLLVVRDEPDHHHSGCGGDADFDHDAHTTTTTTPPTTSPSTIAFTGALLSQEWLVGLAALLLGSGLVVFARWRRRSPGHAASKK